MSVIITNISTHYDTEGVNQYILKINDKLIARFEHIRSDGLAECLLKAARAVDLKNVDVER